MPRFSDFEGTPYLKAENLKPNEERSLTITNVKEESIGAKRVAVVYFQGEETGLVLNQTNAKFLRQAFGDDTTNCHGANVVLFRTSVDYNGQMVPALRLKLPRGQTPPTPEERARQDIDDAIPF